MILIGNERIKKKALMMKGSDDERLMLCIYRITEMLTTSISSNEAPNHKWIQKIELVHEKFTPV